MYAETAPPMAHATSLPCGVVVLPRGVVVLLAVVAVPLQVAVAAYEVLEETFSCRQRGVHY